MPLYCETFCWDAEPSESGQANEYVNLYIRLMLGLIRLSMMSRIAGQSFEWPCFGIDLINRGRIIVRYPHHERSIEWH
jgi:hypothetical protein